MRYTNTIDLQFTTKGVHRHHITRYYKMFGLPQQEVSEQEKRAHQEQTEKTLKQAAYVAAFLWVSPMIWHLVKKQWK